MRDTGGFSLIEALVALAVISLGIAGSLTVLTKSNSFASMSRNFTGAYTAVQNQIDGILDNGPFNPQKKNADGTPQIPPELTLGTTTKANVPVYEDPTTGVVVSGTLTTVVTDVSTTYYGITMYMYQATVTITYKYLNRNYSFSMCTVRTSDI